MKKNCKLLNIINIGVILSISIAALLYYGNPQWSRYIWWFQYNIRKGGLRFVPTPHEGYATIKHWYWGLNFPSSVTSCYNGKRHGLCIDYHSNGVIENKIYYKNGTLDGLYITYDRKGSIVSKGEYCNGKKREGTFLEDEEVAPSEDGYGIQVNIVTYKKGIVVNKKLYSSVNTEF